MAKYRLLTKDELESLEKEFIEYLVVNGIEASDWRRMKEQDIDKAEQVVDLFSDVVFESIMQKAKFLEYRSQRYVHAFQCLPNQMVLVGMRAGNDAPSDVDFTDSAFIAQAMQRPPAYLEVYTTSKEYAKERTVELFEMVAQGCELSDGRLFKTLSLLLAQSK